MEGEKQEQEQMIPEVGGDTLEEVIGTSVSSSGNEETKEEGGNQASGGQIMSLSESEQDKAGTSSTGSSQVSSSSPTAPERALNHNGPKATQASAQYGESSKAPAAVPLSCSLQAVSRQPMLISCPTQLANLEASFARKIVEVPTTVAPPTQDLSPHDTLIIGAGVGTKESVLNKRQISNYLSDSNHARNSFRSLEEQSQSSDEAWQTPPNLHNPLEQPGAISILGPGFQRDQEAAAETGVRSQSMDASGPTESASMGQDQSPMAWRDETFEPENPVQATLVGFDSEIFTAQPIAIDLESNDRVEEAPHEGNATVEWKDIVQTPKIRYGLFIACCILVLLVVGLATGLAMNNNNNKQAETSSGISPSNTTNLEATASPTQKEYPPFSPLLHPQTQESILQDPKSPAALANAWSWEDPYRQDYSTERQLFRFALATLYYALNGDHWNQNDKWLQYDEHECNWYSAQPGGACRNNMEWYATNLSHNALAGILPLELGIMREYQEILDLHNNTLTGPAPPLRHGAKTGYIDVSSNKLEGQVTAEAAWENDILWYANISNNLLSGVVPTYFAESIPSLEIVDCSFNNFTGIIHDSYGSESTQKNLKRLLVAGNQLEGDVPPSLIKLMPQMEQLDISGNIGLEGSISSWTISNTSNITLLHLDISGTSLTGSVPDAFCELQALGDLQLKADCSNGVVCCGGS